MQEVWGSDVPRRGIGTWGGWASQPPTGQLRDSVHAEAPPNPYLQCFEERLCRRLYATRPLCSGPKFCDDRCRHVATFPAFANFANSIMADMARYRCERRLVICSLRKAMVRDPAGLILPPHPRECCLHRRWAFPRHSLRDDSVRDDCAGSCISRFVSRAVQLEDLRTFLRRRLRRSVCVCVCLEERTWTWMWESPDTWRASLRSCYNQARLLVMERWLNLYSTRPVLPTLVLFEFSLHGCRSQVSRVKRLQCESLALEERHHQSDTLVGFDLP